MALLQLQKMVSVQYLLKNLVYWIHIYTGIYNHKISVKFNLRYNPPIIMGFMASLQPQKMFPLDIFLKYMCIGFIIYIQVYNHKI